MTHFLDLTQITPKDMHDILDLSDSIQKNGSNCLKDLSIGLIFEKPSNRTRLSFEVGIQQMGGTAVYIKGDEVQLGEREPVSHVSRVMSRYFDLMVYRTVSHKKLVELAEYATVPVINGLSDYSHPCQAVADALTIKKHFGGFDDVHLTYVGDGNNVCQSLIHVSQLCGFKMSVVCPAAYAPKKVPDNVTVTQDLFRVMATTNVIYCDVWVSMGDEPEAAQRATDFAPYQVNRACLEQAAPNAIFLHCLPANIGQEVTNEVFESSQSKVFDQAENRMHAQKGIMRWVMDQKGL
jgi:ornithine carbamoyltransferase